MAERARQIPAQVDAFRRFYLNQWTESESAWLDMAAWDACSSTLPDEALKGAVCYGGLDLSSTTDLTAFVLVFPVEDRLYVRHWCWIPSEGIRERELRDRVPYRRWAEQGRIELTPGNVIDSRYIVRKVLELAQRYRIRRLNFDRWGATTVYQELQDGGLTVVEMGQGFAAMSAPTKELQSAVLSGRLAHGGCPVLRWQTSCCTVATDPVGNIKIVKADRLKHAKRVDSIVALAMAMDGVMRDPPKESVYESKVIEWV